MIGSRNSRYPRLLVDFEAEVKMTGSARAKNRKKFTLYFFLYEVHFYSIILEITKTTNLIRKGGGGGGEKINI